MIMLLQHFACSYHKLYTLMDGARKPPMTQEQFEAKVKRARDQESAPMSEVVVLTGKTLTF